MKVICINNSLMIGYLTLEKEYDVRHGDQNWYYLKDDNGDMTYYLKYRFKIKEEKVMKYKVGDKVEKYQIGDTFSALNKLEAEGLIGKVVEFSNNGFNWSKKGKFTKLYDSVTETPSCFHCKGEGYYPFIRVCEETMEPPVDPNLIKALKKSIAQWEIMVTGYEYGVTKKKAYKLLGGDINTEINCFLCDAAGYSIGETNDTCVKCIQWSNNKDFRGAMCLARDSIYNIYDNNMTQENAIEVLNHLKNELKRLTDK